MMKAAAASALITTAAAGGTLALTWSDCGDADTHAVVKKVEPATLTLGQSTHIVGTGNVDEQVTGGTFNYHISADGLINDQFSGDICAPKSHDIKVLGVKIGTLSWTGLSCPIAAGAASVPMDVELASALPASLATTQVALTATSTSGDKLICVDLTLKKQALEAPTQPHLAQAWTALSFGDGDGNQTGQESYYVSADKKFKAHKWVYPSCTKLSLHDPSSPYLKHRKGGELNYYLGCYSVNCCYKDFQMKEWDIATPGLLTKVAFVGLEDTTELNDNPVSQAEHWHQNTTLFLKTSVAYEYFVTRTETNTSEDIISHRIDYGAEGPNGPLTGGSVLYGNFQAQHNLDDFRQTFAVPEVCQRPNLLKCPSAEVSAVEQKHFKHDYFVNQLSEQVLV